MFNIGLFWIFSLVVSFLFVFSALRLGVHDGMRDFTRDEAARRQQRP
jgi:hypothetical protein